MPNCFTLIPKGTNTPAKFAEIDDKLRKAFNQPEDAEKFLWGWYDTIGLALACGKDWDWVRENCGSEDLRAVVNWLEGRYDTDSWFER